jgi:hypothetical protein
MNSIDNEETIFAFSDWLTRFKGFALGDDEIEDYLSTVHKFAQFIRPVPLTKATLAQIKAFRREVARGDRKSLLGVEAFHSFRESVLKTSSPRRTA